MLSEFEKSDQRYRSSRPAGRAEDSRSIVEMLRDATLASPTGEPFFTATEQERYDMLAAEEAVVEEAEAIRNLGEAVMEFSGGSVDNVDA